MKGKKRWIIPMAVTMALVLSLGSTLIAGANSVSPCSLLLDRVNIGDTSSDGGHNLVGWSDAWVKPGWGGVYGGGSADGTFRLLMGRGDCCDEGCEDARFTMDAGTDYANRLILHHLDGSQTDDFTVSISDDGSSWTDIGYYEHVTTSETWVTTDYDFSARTGLIHFKLHADSPVPSWCPTWGLVAFSWAELCGVYGVNVDIKPTSCPNPINFKSKGVLPVAILGTEDFDVTTIDPASVELMGVSPLRWKIDDVATPYDGEITEGCCECCTEEGPDGYADLALKFSTQEIVAALGDVAIADCVILRLTGNLREEFDEDPFIGEDVVKIINKTKGCTLVGQWLLSYTRTSPTPGGPYEHNMDITTQSFSGSFSGTGNALANIWTWVVDGSISGSTVDMTIIYDQPVGGTDPYIVELEGIVVDCETTMSGTALDAKGQQFDWTATRQ